MSEIQMPSSGGGLVRYSDEAKSKLMIPPMAIAIAIGVVALIGILLYKGIL